MSVSRPIGVQLVVLVEYSSGVVNNPRDLQVSQHVVSVEPTSLLLYKLYLCFICSA